MMPLPLTVSCFSKIQIGFTFLVPSHPGSPEQRDVKCVCACVIEAYDSTIHVQSGHIIWPNVNEQYNPIFGAKANTKRLFGTALTTDSCEYDNFKRITFRLGTFNVIYSTQTVHIETYYSNVSLALLFYGEQCVYMFPLSII